MSEQIGATADREWKALMREQYEQSFRKSHEGRTRDAKKYWEGVTEGIRWSLDTYYRMKEEQDAARASTATPPRT